MPARRRARWSPRSSSVTPSGSRGSGRSSSGSSARRPARRPTAMRSRSRSRCRRPSPSPPRRSSRERGRRCVGCPFPRARGPRAHSHSPGSRRGHHRGCSARSRVGPGEIIVSALPQRTTGAERIVEALDQLGVTVAFGLPGVHNLAIWQALSRSKIRLIAVRHEQTAVYAADGYARTTGRLGVALVTTGPGAANTLAATGEAWASGSPAVVVATDIPSGLRRPGTYRGVLHENRDQEGMFAPVVKAARTAASAAPVALTYAAKGLLPPDHPCLLPATLHAPDVGAVWDGADLVIAIGTDLDGMSTQNWALPRPPRLLAINVDPLDAEKNYEPDVTLVGDASAVAANLGERVAPKSGLERVRERVGEIGGRVR